MFLFWKHIKDFNIHFLGFLAHNAVVTQSVFAPVPQLVFDQLEQNSGDPLNQQQQPGIIDFTGFFWILFFIGILF